LFDKLKISTFWERQIDMDEENIFLNEPLVMKFGGASVATSESFLKIAELIIERSNTHAQIAVVISAMANTTDQLLQTALKVHPNPPRREQDMLVSVGERISIALLAMALSLKGKEAVSFTGSQSGIVTCENHAEAQILDVRPQRITAALKQNKIAIIAGFQGVSRQKEITTLGRGGSDTSAVALAVALNAPTVEFYKDVAGFFEEDPKKNPAAHLHSRMSYAKALSLAQKGAKVLHARSIQLAERNGVQLSIRSFHNPSVEGTLIGAGEKRKSEMIYEADPCS
jgi:aspartate kinase